MGVFQGLTSEQGNRRYPNERAAYRADDSYVIPGGESGAQRADRALACLDELATRYPGQTLIVITHAGLLAGILERALVLPPGTGRRFRKPNVAINIFVRNPAGWALETWGDTAHLRSENTSEF